MSYIFNTLKNTCI